MKDIKGYEGRYAITSCGKVWSYRSKKFLKPSSCSGYLRVTLSKDNKQESLFIHRLVLETYCPIEGMEKFQVNHKDEIKEHNYLNNLEWLTRKENCNFGTRNERISTSLKHNSEITKKVRCVETGIVYLSTREAMRQTEVNQSSISKVCRGKLKTAGGFHWEFLEEIHKG